MKIGWTDLIFTHLSARVPGEPEHQLINPYGLLFEEITANNLLKVDFDGNVITGDYPYNNAGHAIHTAILRGRPDVNVALHSHTRAGIAVSCLEEGLLPLSQQAEVAYKVQVDVMAAGAKRRMPNKEALASIGRFSVMPKDGPAPYVGITQQAVLRMLEREGIKWKE